MEPQIDYPSENVAANGEGKAAASAPELLGAEGQGILGGRTLRSDFRHIERAIRERWPIADSTRERIVNRLARIIDQSPDDRHVIAAARALIAADGQNIAADRPAPVRQSMTVVNVGLPANPEDQRIFADAAKLLRRSPE